jgi:hypothetical protein
MYSKSPMRERLCKFHIGPRKNSTLRGLTLCRLGTATSMQLSR